VFVGHRNEWARAGEASAREGEALRSAQDS
jgi:hypothetical protein